VRSHLDTEEEAREHAKTLDLRDVASRIRCPLLVVFGKQDRLIAYQDAERLAAEASGPTDLWMIEDGNHGAANRPYRHVPQSADWMTDRLREAD
jgi:2,6-dihydroxypseudooxynicotine hydrolase